MPTSRLSLKSRRSRPRRWSNCHQRGVRLTDAVHERQGREINKSNEWRAPISPPLWRPHSPLYRCLHATSVRDSIHIHGQPAQHQRSQLTRVVDLPLCLPFAVIVTLLDVSLEQDAHLPLRAWFFFHLSLSVVSLSGYYSVTRNHR